MTSPPPEFFCSYNNSETTEDGCRTCRITGQKVRDKYFYGSKSPFATREDCKRKYAQPLKREQQL